MIVVFERTVKDHNKCNLSLLSLEPDAFTEIRFFDDKIQINSKTSFDSYLEYRYSDWSIKEFVKSINESGLITGLLQEELFKRFKVINKQDKTNNINESIGILGN